MSKPLGIIVAVLLIVMSLAIAKVIMNNDMAKSEHSVYETEKEGSESDIGKTSELSHSSSDNRNNVEINTETDINNNEKDGPINLPMYKL